ncbi:hypothetical protein SAMN05216420_11376 [Nitrosospira sp. Nl5]|uniref:hypothetical protein n=1 Tax=Nitrosospira sp. Nl5 TaxID=200120 RepID=UPI00088C669D|nr:hypothetical protein [Nitrosospira sp. Nl5]SCY70008.1 hypothetical protein SAMN05216420_11376 [Nitrosospira sp. Nl5]
MIGSILACGAELHLHFEQASVPRKQRCQAVLCLLLAVVTVDGDGLHGAGQITAFHPDLDHLCRAAFYCIGVFPVLFAYIFA